MPASTPGPLSNLRVIDLSREITGPYASKLFADAGADVVKVESSAGDPLRHWSASNSEIPSGDSGALFKYLNSSKRGVVADAETPAGRDFILDLVAGADLVIENYGAGEADRLGVGWEAISARNPRCSLVSISPFGGEGPWATRPCTEFTLQAAVGSTGHRGHPDRGPASAGGRLGEWIPGVYAAVGGLCAWISARKTGVGQHVDLSIFETLCLSMTIYHDLNGQFFEGPLKQSIETPSIERAKDGWVGLCTITGQQWKDFCTIIGRPEVAEDERYFDAKVRMDHLEFIKDIIEGFTTQNTVDEIIELVSLMRIPVNPLGDGRTLLEMDQFQQRGVFIDNPAGFKQPRPPYRLRGVNDGAPPDLRPAPALGEHDEEVRAELSGAKTDSPAPEGGDAFPFEGLRVLDLCAFWAGPVGTSFLGDLGADVIKVESIQRPDGMRFAGSVANDEMWEWNPIHHGCNSSKRAITLQLDTEEGLALVKRLVEKADVVIDNFSPRVLSNFGLDWDVVHALNPRAIQLRMPSFGLDGPWRDRVGFAMNIEQVSGLAWLTGYSDMPLVVRGSCDPLGGMHAVFALSLALEERRRTGIGQFVEVPLVEPAINVAAEQVIEWTANGRFLECETNRGPFAAPQGVYACADENVTGEGSSYVAIAVATDAHWESLCSLLGATDWASDAALASADGRRAAHDSIDARIREWTEQRSMAEAEAELLAAGIPANACTNSHSLYPNEQLEARGFFQWMEHPRVGQVRYPGQPMSFSGLPRALRRRPAPLLGEHNDEVLREELGLSDAEIEKLRELKRIGNRPSFM